jgi:hypothetical protein
MGCIQQYDMAARPVEALMRTPTRPQPFSKWKFELNWPAHFPGGGFLESFFFLLPIKFSRSKWYNWVDIFYTSDDRHSRVCRVEDDSTVCRVCFSSQFSGFA